MGCVFWDAVETAEDLRAKVLFEDDDFDHRGLKKKKRLKR
jgi:hypothetical protein